MKLYVRIVELRLGASGESYTSITNVKSVKWRRPHTINPQLLPSSKIPVGWLQGHSWIEGEFTLLSDNPDIGYFDPQGDSTIIPYFMLGIEQPNKSIYWFNFVGALIFDKQPSFNNQEGEVTYPFVAYYVEE